jgi:Ser/Thr protein kinase RdoA (MazF antagonist)
VRTEPDGFDKDTLIELLRDRYLLEVAALTFVPYGIDSWSYVATGRDGDRCFVKLTHDDSTSVVTAWEMPLMAALAAAKILVPRPIADRDGAYVNALGHGEVRVLEYLPGRTLEHETEWPDAILGRVADAVAGIHASTNIVRHLVPRVEDFDLPFIPGLTATLAAVDKADGLRARDKTVSALRELVVPRASDLNQAIARLMRLRDFTSVRRSEEVLCHTDIWGSNLMLSDDGEMHVLDWDGALIGPPERDLFMFAGTSFFPAARLAWFLDRYGAVFRPERLDAEAFGFYLYRRNLEDLAWFVAAIAEGRDEAMAPETMLAIVADLLSEITPMEGLIDRVREVLTARPALAVRPSRHPGPH